MNLFGNSTADGSGRLVRQVAIAGIAVVVAAVAAATFLDRAGRDGTLAAFGGGDPARHMANVPRAGQTAGGVRYGNVDYMPTASIPGDQQKVKNVVSDPGLGMPN